MVSSQNLCLKDWIWIDLKTLGGGGYWLRFVVQAAEKKEVSLGGKWQPWWALPLAIVSNHLRLFRFLVPSTQSMSPGCLVLRMVTNEVNFGFGHLAQKNIANSARQPTQVFNYMGGYPEKKNVVILDFVKITFFAIWFCFKLFPTAFGSFEQDCKRIIPQYFTMLSCCLLRLVLDETKYIYVE